MELFTNLYEVLLEALPFLALGFVIAGLLQSFVPNDLIAKHLGKENIWSPVKAAMLGAPIPLCSCSVVPVAGGLRRGGAGKGSLTSFLISAPETGVDSMSISYAMLGPIMLIARIISALLTAILTAWAVMGFTKNTPLEPMQDDTIKSCCGSKKSQSSDDTTAEKQSIFKRFITGQRYAFTMLLDDSIKWVMVALIATAIIKTYVPESFFTGYGDGMLAMLIMVLVSFPMYICASASTPIAASLLMVGISPGAALVFMLAGPASNIATIGVVKELISKKAAVIYTLGVCVISMAAGMILNAVVGIWDLDVIGQVQHQDIIPMPLAIGVSAYVLLATVKPLRPYIGLVAR